MTPEDIVTESHLSGVAAADIQPTTIIQCRPEEIRRAALVEELEDLWSQVDTVQTGVGKLAWRIEALKSGRSSEDPCSCPLQDCLWAVHYGITLLVLEITSSKLRIGEHLRLNPGLYTKSFRTHVEHELTEITTAASVEESGFWKWQWEFEEIMEDLNLDVGDAADDSPMAE